MLCRFSRTASQTRSVKKRGRRGSALSFRPLLEALEDRSLPSVYAVTNVLDAGAGSLRQAILDANANPGADDIAFAIEASGVQTIQPLSALPTITDPVVIDGYTQPGATPNTLADGNDAVLRIELDGSLAGAGANGLWITAGNSTVRGLVINRFGADGIVIQSAGGNVVEGNFLGTDVSGRIDLGNGIRGVFVHNSSDHLIGGTTPAARNLISGNGDGIEIWGREAGASGNRIEGNFIGTDVTGTAFLGNANVGVRLPFVTNTTVGGASAGARNVISGNFVGVALAGADNVIQGNYIGPDVTLTRNRGNTYDGVFLDGFSGNDTSHNLIADNRIMGSKYGVEVMGTGATDNRIEGNFFHFNHVAGVILWNGANRNLIGGTTAGDGNYFGNNGTGITLSGAGTTQNLVQGNAIGVFGTAIDQNLLRGVLIEAGASANAIAGNTVSGNGFWIGGGAGVEIAGSGTTDNVVEGNRIGTDASGTVALGNAGPGVWIHNGASRNTVVGTGISSGNVIAANGGDGVRISGGARDNVVQRNRIEGNAGNGVRIDGSSTAGNQLEQNQILRNRGDGVLIDGAFANIVTGDVGFTSDTVISGNFGDGVEIRGSGAFFNWVQYLGRVDIACVKLGHPGSV